MKEINDAYIYLEIKWPVRITRESKYDIEFSLMGLRNNNVVYEVEFSWEQVKVVMYEVEEVGWIIQSKDQVKMTTKKW